jgi:hypothetical protein
MRPITAITLALSGYSCLLATLLKDTPGTTAPASTATAGMSQNGTQTGIKEVKPDKPKAGEHAIIFGAALDKANVDGIKLVMFGRHDLNLPIVKQDATSIQFPIPPGTPDGKYTLTVMAKNSANIQTSFQVGDDPVPTVSEHPESVKPGSTVTFSGAASRLHAYCHAQERRSDSSQIHCCGLKAYMTD